MSIITKFIGFIERFLWRKRIEDYLKKYTAKEIANIYNGRSSRVHGYDLNQVMNFLATRHKKRNKKNAK